MPRIEDTYDVIVAGAGGSGLAAAASAAAYGASVLVLEKQPRPGGTTGMAVGSFTANRTDYQRREGLEDSPEAHNEDAGRFPPPEYEARNNHELRQYFLEHAAETLHWLRDLGIVFHGPSPEPPNRVARMHNVVPAAKAYIYTLQKELAKHGGMLLCDAPVTALERESGRVTGVRARIGGTERTVRARKGVVLAAGDYAQAPDLIAEYKGEAFGAIEGINRNANGDGQRLAASAGAPLVNMDVTYGPELRFVPPEKQGFVDYLPAGGPLRTLMGRLMPFVPKPIVDRAIKRQLVTWQHPEDSLFSEGAILLNEAGERFCDELETPAREIALARQPNRWGFILLDRRLIERFSDWPHFVSTAPEIAYAYVADYLRLRPDVAVEAGSLEAVARKRGLASEALCETVDAFNRVARGEVTDAFGRGDVSALLEGDRWVLLGPAKAYFTTTEGSPAVNLGLQVLDESGAPIPGLYAVGQNGLGGQVLFGHGLHIAWAMTSGRLVGRALAE